MLGFSFVFLSTDDYNSHSVCIIIRLFTKYAKITKNYWLKIISKIKSSTYKFLVIYLSGSTKLYNILTNLIPLISNFKFCNYCG